MNGPLLTAIIPDPEFYDGACRKEVYGDNPKQLAEAAHDWLWLNGYDANQVGANFNVYREGNLVGTLTYNCKFYWADPLYDPANPYHKIDVQENQNNESRCINHAIKGLTDIDCALSSIVGDYQTKAEADPEFTSHDRYDNGKPFCLPEDANPDLDAIRVTLDEAIMQLQAYVETIKGNGNE